MRMAWEVVHAVVHTVAVVVVVGVGSDPVAVQVVPLCVIGGEGVVNIGVAVVVVIVVDRPSVVG